MSGKYMGAFFGLFTKDGVDVKAVAESKIFNPSRAPYVDIHFIIDDSMSMGIGQTTQDQLDMVNDNGTWSTNQEPCGVACHLSSPAGVTASWGAQIYSTYDYYQNQGIRMRIDAVKDALNSMLSNMQTSNALTSNTRVSITPLSQMQNVGAFGFNTSLQTAITEVQNTTLAPNDIYPFGMTEIGHALFDRVAKKITNTGDGSSSSAPRVYVVLVTDGMAHFESSSPYSSPGSTTYVDPLVPSQFMQAIDPSVCQPVKNKNATLMVMNVEYLFPPMIFLQNPGWQPVPWQTLASYPGTQIDYQRYSLTNAIIPELQPAIEACASANPSDPSQRYAFRVDHEDEMKTAFNQIYTEIFINNQNKVALSR